MSPVEALFLKCHPVIYITAKCKSEVHEYPPHIPHQITKYLEFQVVSITNQYIHAIKLWWENNLIKGIL